MAVSISIGVGNTHASQSNAITISDNADGTSTITYIPEVPALSLIDNANGTGTVAFFPSAYAFSGQTYSYSSAPFTY